MSALTATIATIEERRGEWRDQMIQMGVETYWNYEVSGELDTETAVTLVNAMKDKRVRDCLMWHFVKFGDARRVVEIIDRAMPYVPGQHAVDAAVMCAISSAIEGDDDGCVGALGYANFYGPDDSFVLLATICVKTGGPALLAENIKHVVADLTYEESRYGQNK